MIQPGLSLNPVVGEVEDVYKPNKRALLARYVRTESKRATEYTDRYYIQLEPNDRINYLSVEAKLIDLYARIVLEITRNNTVVFNQSGSNIISIPCLALHPSSPNNEVSRIPSQHLSRPIFWPEKLIPM